MRDRLRILARGGSSPQAVWLNAGLAALGHEVSETSHAGTTVDLLLVHDPAAITIEEVGKWRRSGVCTVLRAWNDPDTFDASGVVAGAYDYVLTSGLADMVRLYKDCGARALSMFPSAPPLQLDPTKGTRDIDMVFAGRLDTAERRHRLEFLKLAASRWRVAVATSDTTAWPGAFPLEPGILADLHRRARLALHIEAIAVNRFGITRRCPGTRPFFGPAYGAVLLTELRRWLTHCYDPENEMSGFSDVAHGLEVAAGLLEQPERLKEIATAAAERMSSHTPEQRACQVAALATGQVPIEMSVLSLGPWYQQINLPGGVRTSLLACSNTHRWSRMQSYFPDVRGLRVLDLGSNSGFFSLQCIQRGASQVVGIDASPLACAQARFIKKVFDAAGMEILERDVTEAPSETFDVCLILAVLHHLADINPLLQMATAQASTLLLEWEVRPQPYFHPVEEVLARLEFLGWKGTVKEGGRRPIILGRKNLTK